jgi:nucleoid-associated protein YejK
MRANAKSVCDRRKCCSRCGLITKKHECNKRYCANCQHNKEVGHQCYMQPLTNVLPSSDFVLYVFYDFETTKNSRFSEKATLHVPNLACLQQFCSKCEGIADIEIHCDQCGNRKHSFWIDPVGDMLFICASRNPGSRR